MAFNVHIGVALIDLVVSTWCVMYTVTASANSCDMLRVAHAQYCERVGQRVALRSTSASLDVFLSGRRGLLFSSHWGCPSCAGSVSYGTPEVVAAAKGVGSVAASVDDNERAVAAVWVAFAMTVRRSMIRSTW